MAKTFDAWLLYNYGDPSIENVGTPESDLADDIYRDDTYPVGADKSTALAHLKNKGACPQAIRTFKQCWTKYEKQVPAHRRIIVRDGRLYTMENEYL